MLSFLQRMLCSFLTFFVVFHAGLFGYSSDKLKTMNAVEKIEDGLYVMDYVDDYDSDAILKGGYPTHVQMFLRMLCKVMRPELPGFGCSTFNAVTPDGQYLFARNFDYMDCDQLLVWTHPKNGYASVSSVSPLFLGYGETMNIDTLASRALLLMAHLAPLDGMNEKGLSIGVLELTAKPTFQLSTKPDLTTTTMIRAVLDKAATVDEAIEIFRTHDMRDFLLAECAYHYQIADASGKSVVIEYVDGKMNILEPERRENAAVDSIAATNFFLTPGVDDPNGMGQDRHETMMTALDHSGGVATSADAMQILQSVSMENADLHGFICDTLWSVVYNQTDLTASLCAHNNFEKVYTFSVTEPQVIR